MSVTVKNDFDAFPSSASVWFVNSFCDNTSHQPIAISSAGKSGKHEGTDMWKSEAGGEFQVLLSLLSASWWDKICLSHSSIFI